MIEPTEADIGRRVIYRVYTKLTDGEFSETGVISSFTNHCVFVRYGNNTGTKATFHKDLYWEHEA